MGKTGASGGVTGPHGHFEVIKNGKRYGLSQARADIGQKIQFRLPGSETWQQMYSQGLGGRFQLNGDTGTNYSRHGLYGTGSAAAANGVASSGVGNLGVIDNTASVFSVAVVDILDYTNTNKYTTVRSLNGYDANGSGYVFFASTAWMNTAAVTSITLFPSSSSFQQYSSFALYGIKGA